MQVVWVCEAPHDQHMINTSNILTILLSQLVPGAQDHSCVTAQRNMVAISYTRQILGSTAHAMCVGKASYMIPSSRSAKVTWFCYPGYPL